MNIENGSLIKIMYSRIGPEYYVIILSRDNDNFTILANTIIKYNIDLFCKYLQTCKSFDIVCK
jgi:hypothetical protein